MVFTFCLPAAMRIILSAKDCSALLADIQRLFAIAESQGGSPDEFSAASHLLDQLTNYACDAEANPLPGRRQTKALTQQARSIAHRSQSRVRAARNDSRSVKRQKMDELAAREQYENYMQDSDDDHTLLNPSLSLFAWPVLSHLSSLL